MVLGVTWKLLSRPGTTSIFIKKPGIQKEWMTSGEARSKRTLSSTGSQRVAVSRPVPEL